MKKISGGVCTPKGFKANGIHCGIRKSKTKKDLALIVSEKKASAAAVYTMNKIKGAPIVVTQENLKEPYAVAMICNSGIANTCNANGIEIANEMCKITAQKLECSPTDIIVASTGVIGPSLDLKPIKDNLDLLVEGLNVKGELSAAEAIMTRDTKIKEIAIKFELNGKECTIGAIAKGSGMIHPNMATMLIFITTDVAITPELLSKALKENAKDTFNMISVDGDTSTNDMVSILANGLAGNTTIASENEEYNTFKKALYQITVHLCKEIAKDGEGATKLIECKVINAQDKKTAKTAAKNVICSSLVKTAIFGADANWGRIMCAIGYADIDVNINNIDISFKSKIGEIQVCSQGSGMDFSEELAKKILSEDEIQILINLNSGNINSTAWGCDLSYEYIRINGDYRHS